MRTRWLAVATVAVIGCGPNDAAGLGRIGGKLRDRAGDTWSKQANGPLLREFRASNMGTNAPGDAASLPALDVPADASGR